MNFLFIPLLLATLYFILTVYLGYQLKYRIMMELRSFNISLGLGEKLLLIFPRAIDFMSCRFLGGLYSTFIIRPESYQSAPKY
ncbi:hypothetical protein LI328DRAFT_123353 [Trichoderma asperelloides]|nr:hypothetical protein LI328DRAFT_123353 [Trichoderma asperelloides]